MRHVTVINVVAAATTLAAWWWLYLHFHPGPPRHDLSPHEAVGEALAAEAVRRLEPGARLIVLARDPQPFLVPASAAQAEGFAQAVKKSGKTVAVTHAYKLDPLRPVGVPPGDFFDLIRQGRDNDVIVSFLGPPVLTGEQLARLGSKRPSVLAVCAGAIPAQVDLKRLFDQKLLSAVVISRMGTLARAGAGSKQAAFEHQFKLITSANLSDLPGGAGMEN
jgi:hypothetical protein